MVKREFEIPELGQLRVEISALSGSTVYINDSKLFRRDKTTYVYEKDGKEEFVSITGNQITGMNARVLNEDYTLVEPFAWYQYILAFVPIFLSLTLGNLSVLAKNGFHFVGGAIGGGIGGVFSALSLYVNAYTSKKWIRILLQILFIVLSFLVCFVVGNILFAINNR